MPIVAIITILCTFAIALRRTGSLYTAVLLTHVALASFVLLASEILGAMNRFQPHAIALTWAAAAVASCRMAIKSKAWHKLFTHIEFHPPFDIRRNLAQILLALLFIAGLAISLAGYPNNWDSMTYHMPRILFWLQACNLKHFATDDFRQLFNPPLAELLQSNALVLCHGYIPAMNLVALMALAILIVSVLHISATLQAPPATRWAIALVVATTPPLLLQSVTTQNDLIMASFLFSGLALLLNAPSSFYARSAGWLAFGLAIAVKATAVFFVPFMALPTLLLALGRRQWSAPLLACLLFIPSIGWTARNVAFFGNPLGYQDASAMARNENYYRNGFFSPAQAIGCLAKNLSLFAATPIPAANRIVAQAVLLLHKALKLNPNDPRLTWYESQYEVPLTGPHEDAAPVFWHAALAVIVALLCFLPRTGIGATRVVKTILALSIIGCAASCVYLKWMPWHTRFLCIWPALILTVGTPAVAVRFPIVVRAVAPACCILAAPFFLLCMNRSILGFDIQTAGRPLHFSSVFTTTPSEQYCARNPALAPALDELTRACVACAPKVLALKRVGIDPPVYPIMQQISAHMQPPRFCYADPADSSACEQADTIVIVGSPPTLTSSRYIPVLSNACGIVARRP